jgi:glycosyltransferase involved in cell wall biosynthesis
LWITAPSQWLLDEARDSLLANKPMRLVRNGVDLQVYVPGSREQARTELELPQGIPLVVFSATSALVNPFKDGRTTLAALRQLVNCLPQVRLVALGGTTVPPGFESVAGSIIARPFEADPRKVAAYYRAGDVFAHASRADNAPLSIIEAMACGLPVVASAVGGIPEYVEHDKTGLLVPPEDAEALAAAFRRMLEDQELRARLAQEALTVAKQRYDIQDQARSYLAWYTELIRETSSDMGRDR